MNAADTSASSAIAACTPLTVVSRSSTTAEIDTFISDVSTTSTNIAIASSRPRRPGFAIRSALGEPGLRVRELAHTEAAGLAREQERQPAQRRPDPVLVADHGDPLERRRVARAEAGVRGHGVALDLVALGSQQVEQSNLLAVGDLVAEHGFDRVLPVVVLDLADRFEADRSHGHVAHASEHRAHTISDAGSGGNAAGLSPMGMLPPPAGVFDLRSLTIQRLP